MVSEPESAFDTAYRAIRDDLSLLLAEGHTGAWKYPVWMVYSEARIARRRIYDRTVVDAMVLQTAMVTTLAGGTALRDFLEDLEDGLG